MANTATPFGFSPIGTLSGGSPNFRLSERLIASTNTTAIFTGDPVANAASPLTGYIAQATAGTTQLVGIFWGCKFLSVSQGRTVWSRFWPGADANGDVTAYVIDSPDTTFLVQAGASAIGKANLNENVQFAIGTGNTLTGLSGANVQSPAVTSTLPFIVLGFQLDPPGLNGTDITTAFNNVYVGWNLQVFKAGLTSQS